MEILSLRKANPSGLKHQDDEGYIIWEVTGQALWSPCLCSEGPSLTLAPWESSKSS